LVTILLDKKITTIDDPSDPKNFFSIFFRVIKRSGMYCLKIIYFVCSVYTFEKRKRIEIFYTCSLGDKDKDVLKNKILASYFIKGMDEHLIADTEKQKATITEITAWVYSKLDKTENNYL
jgi:hypothetical protein